jgi:hypothetical protein
MALILPNGLHLLMNVSLTGSVLVLRRLRRGVAPAAPVARVARAVVDDPKLAAEFAALVAAHEAERFAAADTVVIRRGELPAFSPA